MKWSIILLTLISYAYACDEVELQHEKNKYSVCVEQIKEDTFYYSKECKDAAKCIDVSSLKKIIYSPNQSPLFSLCYQLKGQPVFSKLGDTNKTIEICLKNKQVIGLNYLMKHYQARRP